MSEVSEEKQKINQIVMYVTHLSDKEILEVLKEFASPLFFRYQNCLWYIRTPLSLTQIKLLIKPETAFQVFHDSKTSCEIK